MIKVNERTIPYRKGTRMKDVAEAYKPGAGYLGASGLAGFGDNNVIRTQKIHDNVYIIRD